MSKHGHGATSYFYSRYNPPPSRGLDCPAGSSMTKQEFKDECDLNVLMSKYKRGLIDDITVKPTSIGMVVPRQPMYGDFDEVGDYHDSQNMIIRARDQFLAMPSNVRDRFKNDPGEFLAFAAGRDVADVFEELGLLTPEATTRRKKEREEKAAAAAAAKK